MKSKNIFLLLLIPIFLEATGISGFKVSIPSIPLSLGGIGFIIFGLLRSLVGVKIKSISFLGLLLIFLGTLLGSFFSNTIAENVSAASAQLLFVLGAYGVALELIRHNKIIFLFIEICMAITLVYWTHYVLDKTIFGNQFISYSQLYNNQGSDNIINHHVAGFHISVSAIYLATRLVNFRKIIGYLVMGLAIVCCVILESRSNTLISIGALFWLITQQNNKGIKHYISYLLSILVVYISIEYLLDQYSFLSRRFNTQNIEYQTQTNQSRLFLYKNYLSTFIDFPFGRGLENPRILYKGTYLNPHNHYLTWILAGGVVSLLGVIIYLRSLYFIIKRKYFQTENNLIFKYLLPLKGSALVLFTTLLTIEFGGAIFILGMAIVIFLEMEHARQSNITQ